MLSRISFARHLRNGPFVFGFPTTVPESDYITCKRETKSTGDEEAK
jgi:hypothetical protein